MKINTNYHTPTITSELTQEEWGMLDWEVNPDSWGTYTGEQTVYLTVAVPTEYAE